MWISLGRRNFDEDCINGIQQNYPQRQIWENKLYMAYRYMIKDAIYKHKLNEDEASMAYSDAILATIHQIDSNKFQQRSSLKTYIFKIFQFKCIDLLRANQTQKSGHNKTEMLEDFLELLPDEQQDILRKLSVKYEINLLKTKIQAMDERCKTIILAWGEGYKDSEIADELGYQSSAVAKTSRLRCLEKLKKLYQVIRN